MDKKFDDDWLQHCYEMGIDSIKRGAMICNCNYRIFGTEKNKEAWELGRKDAKSSHNDNYGKESEVENGN